MKTIEEHNREVLRKKGNKHSTGIMCPLCGNELHYPTPDVVMNSYPPQKDVACVNCGYKGMVYV